MNNKASLIKNCFYFLCPFSLIIGFVVAYSYQLIHYFITCKNNGFLKMDFTPDFQSILIISLFFWCISILFNLYSFIFLEKRDFIPSSEKNKTKHTAMYPIIPKRYLSKIPDDFTYGKYKNNYFRIPVDLHNVRHTLIIGSPGSYKSSTLLNSLIWNYNFQKDNKKRMTVFCIDAKPELSRKSISQSNQDIHIVSPASYDNWGFHVWYGLNSESSDDQIIERCDLIARTLICNPSSNTDNDFFYISAQNILIPILLYGYRKGQSFIETIMDVIQIPLKDLITTILVDDISEEHPKILGMLNVYEGKDESDTINSIELTLRQDLRIFDTETVKYQLSQNPKMASPIDLINGISVFLEIPDNLLTQYSVVFRLITQMVLNYLSSIPEHKRADSDVPLILLLIDEFASLGKLQIQEPLARIRSRKVQIVLCTQNLAGLDMIYGHDGTRTILDNCETTLVFSCRDKPTAEIISAWCGQYQETKLSKNKKHKGVFGDQSLTTSSEYRNVMDISDIMALRKNKELLVFDEGDRYLIQKCPYWKIPLLKNKSDEIKEINDKERDTHD